MNKSKHARPGTVKQLHIRLDSEDEYAIAQGLAAARAIGIASMRTRSTFVRQAIQDMARRNVEAARRLAEST